MWRSWYSTHVQPDHCVLAVEERRGQCLGKFGFPTPVGPRKMKEPMGRRGSRIPERARMMASDTALIASSCPTTRARRISSRCRTFSRSPCFSRATGMPVQAATMSAISSSVTTSRSRRFSPCFAVSRSSSAASRRSRSPSLP